MRAYQLPELLASNKANKVAGKAGFLSRHSFLAYLAHIEAGGDDDAGPREKRKPAVTLAAPMQQKYGSVNLMAKVLALATICPAVTVTTTTLPQGTVGTAYTTTLGASGGTAAYAWTVISGTWPAGLTFNTATGVLSGTAPDTTGAPFTVTLAPRRVGAQARS